MAALRWARQVVMWAVILGIAAAIAAAVLVPRLSGATPYTILTSSMQPSYPPGTLVVVKPVGIDEIAIGDVVTYQLSSGKSTVVTHRVMAISTNLKSEQTFTTQGDANNVADAKPVMPVQIKGKLWYHVPYLGYVNKFITGKERHIAMIIVVSGLLLYAAYMFTGSARERLHKRRGPKRSS